MPVPASKSIAVVVGTRPEIIKLSGVLRRLGDTALIVHTGQHYDANLSAIFFSELGLETPDITLAIGGVRRGSQLGMAISALDDVFAQHRPLAVVVQGDTNTAAAAALAANASEVPLVHVEAGLRSFDRRMPEEHNRVIADHLGDLLLAPTAVNRKNLLAEGIPDGRIKVTGNTVVEAVERLMPSPEERKALLDRYDLEAASFVLSTFHRPENVDDRGRLSEILEALSLIPVPVVLPLHPRAVARVEAFSPWKSFDRIRVVEPIGYREFLGLGAESAFLVSDSGGVQEEVSVYKRPVMVVRRSTERPEVLGTFAERLESGAEILELARDWLSRIGDLHAWLAGLPSPYGDGSASERSVDLVRELLESSP